jgi:hypothetical protein
VPTQPARLQGLCQSRRQVREAHVSGWSPETLNLSHVEVGRTGPQPARFLIGCMPCRVVRLAQVGDSDRPGRTARSGERLGRTQLSAVPGKGRGRVISAGPEPHPGVTSPWSATSPCGLGYAGVHPLLSPGQSGLVARHDLTAV